MKNLINIVGIIWVWFLGAAFSFAQPSITLEAILEKVSAESYPVELAKNKVEIAQAQLNLLKAELRPSLGLDLLLPNFKKSSTQVIQPDGAISFQNISQNNSSASLYINQHIGKTGGLLFVQSDLQRFDDFTGESRQYNGSPFRIGLIQPIFGFNQWKWKKKLLPFVFKEASLNYNFALENAQWQATNLFFDVLISQVNKEIALTNKTVNENLLKITKERYKLGKASMDQQLQLEMEYKNAMLDEHLSEQSFGRAVTELYTFLNAHEIPQHITCEVPNAPKDLILDAEVLVQRALQNHPLLLAYERMLIEQDKNRAQLKAQYGIKANLFLGFGFSKAAENIETIYQQPFDEQQLKLSVSVPIIDWGQKKQALKIATLERKEIEQNIRQEHLVLENKIRNKVQQFLLLKNDLELLKDIKKIAEERFEISRQRYTLGNISITDLTLAQREKDQASRAFILTLRDYWSLYYELRTLVAGDLP